MTLNRGNVFQPTITTGGVVDGAVLFDCRNRHSLNCNQATTCAWSMRELMLQDERCVARCSHEQKGNHKKSVFGLEGGPGLTMTGFCHDCVKMTMGGFYLGEHLVPGLTYCQNCAQKKRSKRSPSIMLVSRPSNSRNFKRKYFLNMKFCSHLDFKPEGHDRPCQTCREPY